MCTLVIIAHKHATFADKNCTDWIITENGGKVWIILLQIFVQLCLESFWVIKWMPRLYLWNWILHIVFFTYIYNKNNTLQFLLCISSSGLVSLLLKNCLRNNEEKTCWFSNARIFLSSQSEQGHLFHFPSGLKKVEPVIFHE